MVNGWGPWNVQTALLCHDPEQYQLLVTESSSKHIYAQILVDVYQLQDCTRRQEAEASTDAFPFDAPWRSCS